MTRLGSVEETNDGMRHNDTRGSLDIAVHRKLLLKLAALPACGFATHNAETGLYVCVCIYMYIYIYIYTYMHAGKFIIQRASLLVLEPVARCSGGGQGILQRL